MVGRTEGRLYDSGLHEEREEVSGQHVENDTDLDVRFESLYSKPFDQNEYCWGE